MARLLKGVIQNLLRQPATRRYPFEVRALPDGTRGHLQNDIARCIFCGMCQRRCPAAALGVTRTPVKTWTFDPYRCIVCSYCVEVCPVQCLSMAKKHLPPQG